MAFLESELRYSIIIYKIREFGGGTHYVDGNPKCLTPLTDVGKMDQYCEKTAGDGTSHPGTGRCRHHDKGDGKSDFNLDPFGRYNGAMRNQLLSSVRKYAQDPDMLDLTPELILLRAMLDLYIRRNPDFQDHNIGMVQNLVNQITGTVERIERITGRHILTVASARLMMTRAIDAARMFIDPEKMEQFIDVWQNDVISPVFGDIDKNEGLIVDGVINRLVDQDDPYS